MNDYVILFFVCLLMSPFAFIYLYVAIKNNNRRYKMRRKQYNYLINKEIKRLHGLIESSPDLPFFRGFKKPIEEKENFVIGYDHGNEKNGLKTDKDGLYIEIHSKD